MKVRQSLSVTSELGDPNTWPILMVCDLESSTLQIDAKVSQSGNEKVN